MGSPVLIVIVNYRSWARLERCLASLRPLLEAGRPVTQIVVVDNASADGAFDAFAKAHPDITLEWFRLASADVSRVLRLVLARAAWLVVFGVVVARSNLERFCSLQSNDAYLRPSVFLSRRLRRLGCG